MQLDHADPTQAAFPGPPKLSDNYRWRFLAVFSSVAVLLLAAIACDNDSTWRPAPGLSGYVRLENQNDHSGVLLRVSELDSTAVTDSTGFFSFGGIPDGSWQIVARYPYFEPDTATANLANGILQERIDITLEQLFQFWIEPSDTTISMSQPGDEHTFRLFQWGHLTNISDHPVTVEGELDPRVFVAIRPTESTASKYCDEHYGWLSPIDAYDWFVFTFEPGEHRAFPLWILGSYMKDCFEPGRYEVYCCISDQLTYREHFEPYSSLNWTLLKKRELLRPGRVRITE
jgi:hypothetical protein